MNITENLLVLLEITDIKSVDDDELFSPVETHFTTKLFPLLASVNDVRRLIGAHITNISDDTIAQLNWKNTQYALSLPLGCDTSDPVWIGYASMWVATLTALTLLDNSEAFTAATSGSVSKTLGDFAISKTGPSSRGNNNGFQQLMDRLECELYKLDVAVRYCKAPRSNCMALEDPGLAAADYNPSLPLLTIRGYLDPNFPNAGRRWLKRPYPSATDNLRVFGRWYKTHFANVCDLYSNKC